MLSVLFFAGFISISLGASWPEFEDTTLGKLQVSGKQFPFLTLKNAPGQILIFPTAAQLNAIKTANDDAKKRMKHKTIGSATHIDNNPPDFELELPAVLERYAQKQEMLVNDLELEDALLDDNGTVTHIPFRQYRQVDEDAVPDLGGEEATEALENYIVKWIKFHAKYLKLQFSMKYLDHDVDLPDSIIFKSSGLTTEFKSLIIKENKLEKAIPVFEADLKEEADRHPWFHYPAKRIIRAIKLCQHTEYQSGAKEDFKFDYYFGGEIVFYKYTCLRLKGRLFIGVAWHMHQFQLSHLEETIVVSLPQKTQILWDMFQRTRVTEVYFQWTVITKTGITAKEWKALRDYVLSQTGLHIRAEFPMETGLLDPN